MLMKVMVVTVVFMPGSVLSVEEQAGQEYVTYDDHIRPLFRRHCFDCHSEIEAKADLNLTHYQGVLSGGSSGEVLAAGDPSQSRLYLLVSHAEEPHMPRGKPRLSVSDLGLIQKWITTGLREARRSPPRQSNSARSVLGVRMVPMVRPSGPAAMPQTYPARAIVRTSRANPITALASSPWYSVVAVGSEGQIILYHTASLEVLGVLPYRDGRPFSLRFSRDGQVLLAAGGHGGRSGAIRVWDVITGEEIIQVGGEADVVLAGDISPDRSLLALGGAENEIRLVDVQSGQDLQRLKKHTNWVAALEFSPDGTMLASGDRSGGFSIWETKTGDELFTFRGHREALTEISWRGDSLVLASASEDETVKLWDCRHGELAKGWKAHKGGVLSVKFTGDGRLVTGGRDGVAKLWDTNGACRRQFVELTEIATRVAVSHDGSRVFTGDWSGQVHVWSTSDGARLGGLSSHLQPLIKP